MPGGFKVELKGLNEVLNQLNVSSLEPEITGELVTFGHNVVQDAQQTISDNGTTDRGLLINSLKSVSEAPLTVNIFSNLEYAAYIEFGTRKFAAAHVATLPPDWKAFAAQYKGSGGGGSFAELLKNITEWVRRKGFAAQVTTSGRKSKSKASEAAQNQAAYLIARSIMVNGIRAQPFFFDAIQKNIPKLLDRLKALL